MTVERISEAILSETRQEAEKTVAEAQVRHDERLAAARKSLDEEFARRFELDREQAQQQGEREIARTLSRHNQSLLRRRNEILDDLFHQAAEHLMGLPDEEYRAVVGAWMQQVPADQAGELLAAARDAYRLAPLVENLNRSRESGTQLTLVPGDRPEQGGAIFRTEKFEIDLSLDTRAARLREELAPDVANIVFSSHASL